jgi:hypothetical protein
MKPVGHLERNTVNANCIKKDVFLQLDYEYKQGINYRYIS